MQTLALVAVVDKSQSELARAVASIALGYYRSD